MAKIKCKGKAEGFTGHIGAAHFINGEAETEVATLVAYFLRDPDRYEVTDTEVEVDGPEDADTTGGDYEPASEAQPDPDEPGQRETAEDDTVESPSAPEADTEDVTEDEPAPEADPYDVPREALRDLARERGLSTSGTVAELQDRLRAHDEDAKGTDDNGE